MSHQNIQSAQARQKLHAENRQSLESSFEVGTRVLLSSKNILQNSGTRELLPLWIETFEVVPKVGKVAYKLLSSAALMHCMLNASCKGYPASGPTQAWGPSLPVSDCFCKMRVSDY